MGRMGRRWPDAALIIGLVPRPASLAYGSSKSFGMKPASSPAARMAAAAIAVSPGSACSTTAAATDSTSVRARALTMGLVPVESTWKLRSRAAAGTKSSTNLAARNSSSSREVPNSSTQRGLTSVSSGSRAETSMASSACSSVASSVSSAGFKVVSSNSASVFMKLPKLMSSSVPVMFMVAMALFGAIVEAVTSLCCCAESSKDAPSCCRTEARRLPAPIPPPPVRALAMPGEAMSCVSTSQRKSLLSSSTARITTLARLIEVWTIAALMATPAGEALLISTRTERTPSRFETTCFTSSRSTAQSSGAAEKSSKSRPPSTNSTMVVGVKLKLDPGPSFGAVTTSFSTA
mmetsp:Transcript_75402/g.135858  ORF Transcript_75402/g.135858 Transcript_75402/m.135858 type:complete len:348 (-) Transcript_75402:1073-2116(-)